MQWWGESRGWCSDGVRVGVDVVVGWGGLCDDGVRVGVGVMMSWECGNAHFVDKLSRFVGKLEGCTPPIKISMYAPACYCCCFPALASPATVAALAPTADAFWPSLNLFIAQYLTYSKKVIFFSSVYHHLSHLPFAQMAYCYPDNTSNSHKTKLDARIVTRHDALSREHKLSTYRTGKAARADITISAPPAFSPHILKSKGLKWLL